MSEILSFLLTYELCSTWISLSLLFQINCFPNCQYCLDIAEIVSGCYLKKCLFTLNVHQVTWLQCTHCNVIVVICVLFKVSRIEDQIILLRLLLYLNDLGSLCFEILVTIFMELYCRYYFCNIHCLKNCVSHVLLLQCMKYCWISCLSRL